MILVQLHKVSCNFIILFNLVKCIVQLSKYGATFRQNYHATQEGCILFWNMYNVLRNVMGVVPGHARLKVFIPH